MPDDGSKDLFAHYSEIRSEGYKSLQENQRVTFEVGTGPKGPSAKNIKLVDQGDAQRRQDEQRVDDGLPHHARLREARVGRAQRARLDEGAQQVDRRDADDGHGQLDLEDAGVDVAEPFRLVRVALQAQARHEGLVAADDHHHQQVRDHHHVDQAQHQQHDFHFAEAVGVRQQMPEFLQEQHHVDALGDDQSQIERQLQPARAENQAGQQAKTGRGVGGHDGGEPL
ncbi:Cold shock-like protein CspA [Beauveria bassiana D1-5]|uniref:Cold shock-like protein CspA n=1 Tax=Beauveria bassiana D1-5 TaxID=1245745 RepID=A0A0A2V452_BEABA|nr:Cold shock-like protein CspA [Beauveria bassiana D1-5]